MVSCLPIRHLWVDSSAAPVYQVTFPRVATDEQLLSYCRAVESWSAQVLHPVAWLMDLSRVEQVSAQQRAIFAKYMETMGPFDQRCTKGTALILPNALLRGIATAVFWLYVPPFPHKTFADCSEGRAWLREMMGEPALDARASAPASVPAGVPAARLGHASLPAPAERASVRPNQRS